MRLTHSRSSKTAVRPGFTMAEMLVVVVMTGVLLALALIAWWLVKLGLRPLEHMQQTAGAIAAGAFTLPALGFALGRMVLSMRAIYLAIAAVGGAAFVGLAGKLSFTKQKADARRLFTFSILYLFLLFAALLGEHLAALKPLALRLPV